VDIALTIPADALAGEHRMRVLYQFNVTGENLDPCVSASYGEGEDYTVNIILLDGCTEANAGTVEGPESVCASTEFTLTADGASALEAGLSGQWQSSADGELWEDIDGETAATLTTSIEEATWFRYTMSCENDPDNPDTSNEVHVTLKPDTECYCIPSSNNIEPITYVKLEEIDNTSSADTSSPAYEDFTDMIASVTPGETYTITLKGNTDGGWTNYFTIFIDYNQNGEFESTEVETAGSISNSTGTDDMELTYDIQIPMDATPGLTRLRIRKNFSTAYLDPCTTNGYGQTEDYTINIIPLDGCTEANAGTVEGPESVCASTEFTLTADGASALEAGLCGQWQSSADGELWEDIDGETAATLTTSIEEATWFRYTMSCENDPDNPDTSNEVHVTLKPVTECHCVPSTSSGATHYINDFTTTGGTVNISNPSGASPEGYTDFTGIPGLTVVQGSDIGYSIGVSGGSTYSRSIWIDYNQDGVFDATERVAFTGYTSPPLIGNFTISMDALTGTTKMRIIAAFSPSDPNDPCVNSGSGEYEDYLITIEAIEQCSGQPDAGIANSPATVGVGETYTVSATDYSIGAGISYQWQSNTDGAGWIDEGEALTAYQNYTATAPETNATQIQWRLMVTCDAALETPSFSEVSTTETIIIYCTPSFSSTSDYITSFGLANLQNPDSGFSTGGYGDFTSMAPANLFEGIESTVNVSTSSGVGGHGLAVWIDYNNNGTFESSELVGTLNSVLQDSDVSIDFTPPVGSSGLHRMRVIYQWSTLGSAINPCVSASWGEAEDYMVNIAPQPECPDLTEAPANVTFDDSVCEEGCEVGGGVIYEPADITIDSISGACPTGSFLEFSTDNGVTWSTDMPE
ncbi:MAG: GEVED domain-containing protein, partial [Acholeplasmataceae bacterium]|nr:GEVED domain-containing protein [Acholeplasmataceae bacterium]